MMRAGLERDSEAREWARKHLVNCPTGRSDQAAWPASERWEDEEPSVAETSVQERLSSLLATVEALSYKLTKAERRIEELEKLPDETLMARAEAALIEHFKKNEDLDAIEFSIEHSFPLPIVEKALGRLEEKGWIQQADDE